MSDNNILTEDEKREAAIANKLLEEASTDEVTDADKAFGVDIDAQVIAARATFFGRAFKEANKGFTLIELLVVITIIFILAALGTSAFKAVSGGRVSPIFHPQSAHAEAEQRQADEMKRANDLKEEELRLLRKAEKQ